MSHPPKARLQHVLNLGLLLWLWADFIAVFFNEWQHNEQYSFGFLVPFLVAYTVYLRFVPKPAADHWAGSAVWARLLAIALVSLIPLRIVLEANPEWRLALWAYALIVYAATCLLLGAWGGRNWFRHSAGAFLLMLFAVPWPTFLEQPLVEAMALTVAELVTGTIGFAGYYAVRQGTTIELFNGYVGVEEACSGIRSLQSSLMGAWFIGEVYRWSPQLRGGFLLMGAAFAFGLNVIRTLILTVMMIQGGPERAEAVHDWLGQGFSIAALGILIFSGVLLQFILRRWARGRQDDVREPVVEPRPVSWLRPERIALLLGVLAASHLMAAAWYYRSEVANPQPLVIFDWDALQLAPEFPEISPAIRNQLRYSEGYQAQWTGRSEEEFSIVFAFRWEKGSISSFAGVHRPETCLPAAGFTLRESRAATVVPLHGQMIAFDGYLFEDEARRFYVFFAVWDEVPGRGLAVARGWRERILQAWKGQRVENRHSVQIVFSGPRTFAEAEDRFRSLLQAASTVGAVPGAAY